MTAHKSMLINQTVLVRSDKSGMWVGECLGFEDGFIVLRNAVRLWSWTAKGGISASALAVNGIDRNGSNRIETPVPLAFVIMDVEVLLSDPALWPECSA